MLKDSDIILLLTATVTPQTQGMKISESGERRRQYEASIAWYLEHTKYRIVVGENSGCSDLIEPFKGRYGDRVELVCYKDTEVHNNYGINELNLIKLCMETSVQIRSCKAVFKITGRLILKNIKTIIPQIKFLQAPFFATNIERHFKYIDARFFAFSKDLFPRIYSVRSELECCDIETALAAMVYQGVCDDEFHLSFLFLPFRVHGNSGLTVRNMTALLGRIW